MDLLFEEMTNEQRSGFIQYLGKNISEHSPADVKHHILILWNGKMGNSKMDGDGLQSVGSTINPNCCKVCRGVLIYLLENIIEDIRKIGDDA